MHVFQAGRTDGEDASARGTVFEAGPSMHICEEGEFFEKKRTGGVEHNSVGVMVRKSEQPTGHIVS